LPLPVESAMPTTAPDPGAALGDRDSMLRLVATLPPKQRAAIALRFYEDMSYDQIADVLGCRAVTARTHVSRALTALRGQLPALALTGEK
jgi:RNA polymerase sigma factor (sigma-70 family)